MPRPRKSEADKRTQALPAKANIKEREYIQRAAKVLGMKEGTFVRSAAMLYARRVLEDEGGEE